MAFHRDVPFIQEYHEGFVIDEDIRAANDVRAIQPDNDDNIWIATRHGVFLKRPGHRAWHLMIEGERRGPAYDVKMDDHGKIWVACWDGVYTNAGGKLGKSAGPKAPVARIVTAKEGIYALGPKGIWLRQGNSWEKKHYTKARSIRAAISDRFPARPFAGHLHLFQN